jgi:hypothetical protein
MHGTAPSSECVTLKTGTEWPSLNSNPNSVPCKPGCGIESRQSCNLGASSQTSHTSTKDRHIARVPPLIAPSARSPPCIKPRQLLAFPWGTCPSSIGLYVTAPSDGEPFDRDRSTPILWTIKRRPDLAQTSPPRPRIWLEPLSNLLHDHVAYVPLPILSF